MSRVVLFFLQNAWSPYYSGKNWTRRTWLLALHASHSGRRLKTITNITDAHCNIWFDNITREVGVTSSSVRPPNYKHIQLLIDTVNPDIIVTAGRHAQKAVLSQNVRLGNIPVVVVSHPASRALPKEQYRQAGLKLNTLELGKHYVLDLTKV